MKSEIIKVLVIDDHQLIIDGLKSIMEGEGDIAFAGGANTMQQALDIIRQSEVDVVMTDINLPGESGIEIARKILEINPEIRILALTMHEDFEMITRMVDAGASGYILKRSNMNEMLDAIRVVANGGKYLGREVQAIMMANMSHKEPADVASSESAPQLTTREKEILTLVSKEMTNEQIAEMLFISERTVETHRRNIFTKTKTKSIIGLIKYAIRHGLIKEDSDR
jgi:DNA-binding NarL/FixJ family response regulator